MTALHTMIDRYELLRPLAAGGMGEVFVGRLHGVAGFESLVAIKVLPTSLSTDPMFVAMFLDEARNVAKLRHENIVEIRDIVEHAGRYHLVMEYIPGQTLRELLNDASIDEQPLFAPRLGARVFSDLANALATVHAAGLVHRDISLNNIMIGDEAVPKLIDFGVARALGTASLTTPGTLKGKFGYMAPEYVRGDAYDHRADLFSLGVVMWELFTRRRLFKGGSAAEQLRNVLGAPIHRIDEVVPDFPAPLADVVAAMLEREPERRIATAAHLRDSLAELAHSLPVVGHASLRAWLDRWIPDKMTERRRRDRALLASSPVDDAAIAEVIANEASIRSADTDTTRGSGPSATSLRLANGAMSSSTSAVRTTRRVLWPALAVLVLAAAGTIGLRALREPGASDAVAPTAGAERRAPPPTSTQHREAGLAAMAEKQYGRAISEFAEAIRLGGGEDLLQLMELARTLQRNSAIGSASRGRDVQMK